MGLPWNKDADALLSKLVVTHTSKTGVDWEAVSAPFPARTSSACEARWWRLEKDMSMAEGDTIVELEDIPTHPQLFDLLKDRPHTLEQISNAFDRGPDIIRERLEEMEEGGYNLVIGKNSFSVITSTVPNVNPPPINISELMGKHFCIAIASDWHTGSKHAQPTHLNEFLKLATEEYGVRHVFVPGDPTDGAYVYGPKHIDNLIPQVRPLNRKRTWQTAEAQVALADIYAPKIEGVEYFVMGGNHDRSLITNSGKDPVRMLCDRRNDMHYGGYDVWSIRLTEKSYIRLVHPSGGVSYARSYKLQKGIESLAFESLREAMVENVPPMVSLLVMGHFHLTNHTPEPPLHGILAGCFQGQTNYLKVKNLMPHVAGIIIEMQFDNRGIPRIVSHTPITFDEIVDDYKNWPTPEILDPDLKADELGVVFSFDGEEPKNLPRVG